MLEKRSVPHLDLLEEVTKTDVMRCAIPWLTLRRASEEPHAPRLQFEHSGLSGYLVFH